MTIHAPPRTKTHTPKKRLFTREEYHVMGETGILGRQERVELLEGEIIVMSPIGNRHAACVDMLAEVFYENGRLSKLAIVRVQNPAAISLNSEPQPDLMLLSYRDDRYVSGHPGPQDILLLAEVADSSLEHDRNIKLAHYAEAGIPEVWIVNLQDDRIESYTEPSPEGYGVSRIYQQGETISPTAFPDLKIAVSDIIPVQPNSESNT